MFRCKYKLVVERVCSERSWRCRDGGFRYNIVGLIVYHHSWQRPVRLVTVASTHQPPRRIHKPQRVVHAVGVSIEPLSAGRILHVAVGREERRHHGVIHTAVHVDEAEGCQVFVARESPVEHRLAVGVIVGECLLHVFRYQMNSTKSGTGSSVIQSFAGWKRLF